MARVPDRLPIASTAGSRGQLWHRCVSRSVWSGVAAFSLFLWPAAEVAARDVALAAERSAALATAAGRVEYPHNKLSADRASALAAAREHSRDITAGASAGPLDTEKLRRMFAEAQATREAYSRVMLQKHALEDAGPLREALRLLLACEQEIVVLRSHDGRIELQAEEIQLYVSILDLVASTYDDLDDASGAFRYFQRLIELDKCSLIRQTDAVLEYEYCSGRLFSRSIILLRHGFKRPDLATQMFEKAVARQFNGQAVHQWPNEWQIPTLYMTGLRSQPYWNDGDAKLALAVWLEENFQIFHEELMAALSHSGHNSSFTQNDHSLITAGSWGELKLFNGKVWLSPCEDVAPLTCNLLSQRAELVGKVPVARTHSVSLPREAGYFMLARGSRLKPHTGPVNFHLYCHLGLIVPPGPLLRVGSGPPRQWERGKALCFDDSYEHEAWYDESLGGGGEGDRYVLMVTFLHPDLGPPEMDPASPLPPPVASSKVAISGQLPRRRRKRRN